ncbi:hypothetical protein SALBM311S_00537 [Streptomyces alboniger]
MAVAGERLRFARDLHDLLGFGLSAITLKSELTFRLVATRPERAREELVGILQISRQALADVRSVARGYREMSLDAEAASADDVLTAAEIEARIDLDCGPVSDRAGTVLATVIREGVTNVLRHSKAQHCVIEAGPASGPGGPLVRLVVANDGADETRRTGSQDGGSGLRQPPHPRRGDRRQAHGGSGRRRLVPPDRRGPPHPDLAPAEPAPPLNPNRSTRVTRPHDSSEAGCDEAESARSCAGRLRLAGQLPAVRADGGSAGRGSRPPQVSHPLSSAILIASTLLRALSLVTALVR